MKPQRYSISTLLRSAFWRLSEAMEEEIEGRTLTSLRYRPLARKRHQCHKDYLQMLLLVTTELEQALKASSKEPFHG